MIKLKRTPLVFASELSQLVKDLEHFTPQTKSCNNHLFYLYQPLFTAKCFYNDLYSVPGVSKTLGEELLLGASMNEMKSVFEMTLVTNKGEMMHHVDLGNC